jgi:hypothetical protein
MSMRLFGEVAAPCALKMCEWHECPQQADTTRTDIGGTTFALCREHERDGEAAGYWRSV